MRFSTKKSSAEASCAASSHVGVSPDLYAELHTPVHLSTYWQQSTSTPAGSPSSVTGVPKPSVGDLNRGGTEGTLSNSAEASSSGFFLVDKVEDLNSKDRLAVDLVSITSSESDSGDSFSSDRERRGRRLGLVCGPFIAIVVFAAVVSGLVLILQYTKSSPAGSGENELLGASGASEGLLHMEGQWRCGVLSSADASSAERTVEWKDCLEVKEDEAERSCITSVQCCLNGHSEEYSAVLRNEGGSSKSCLPLDSSQCDGIPKPRLSNLCSSDILSSNAAAFCLEEESSTESQSMEDAMKARKLMEKPFFQPMFTKSACQRKIAEGRCPYLAKRSAGASDESTPEEERNALVTMPENIRCCPLFADVCSEELLQELFHCHLEIRNIVESSCEKSASAEETTEEVKKEDESPTSELQESASPASADVDNSEVHEAVEEETTVPATTPAPIERTTTPTAQQQQEPNPQKVNKETTEEPKAENIRPKEDDHKHEDESKHTSHRHARRMSIPDMVRASHKRRGITVISQCPNQRPYFGGASEAVPHHCADGNFCDALPGAHNPAIWVATPGQQTLNFGSRTLAELTFANDVWMNISKVKGFNVGTAILAYNSDDNREILRIVCQDVNCADAYVICDTSERTKYNPVYTTPNTHNLKIVVVFCPDPWQFPNTTPKYDGANNNNNRRVINYGSPPYYCGCHRHVLPPPPPGATILDGADCGPL